MLAPNQDPRRDVAPTPSHRRRVGLNFQREQDLKRKLRQTAPSEPWVEAQIKSAHDIQEGGGEILYRYHDPHVFPPGGAKTKMKRCPRCGVFTPPNAFEQAICLDCADHADGWGPSPSAVAIERLRMLRFEIPQRRLRGEDTESLLLEIERFNARQKRRSERSAVPKENRG